MYPVSYEFSDIVHNHLVTYISRINMIYLTVFLMPCTWILNHCDVRSKQICSVFKWPLYSYILYPFTESTVAVMDGIILTVVGTQQG